MEKFCLYLSSNGKSSKLFLFLRGGEVVCGHICTLKKSLGLQTGEWGGWDKSTSKEARRGNIQNIGHQITLGSRILMS